MLSDAVMAGVPHTLLAAAAAATAAPSASPLPPSSEAGSVQAILQGMGARPRVSCTLLSGSLLPVQVSLTCMRLS